MSAPDFHPRLIARSYRSILTSRLSFLLLTALAALGARPARSTAAPPGVASTQPTAPKQREGNRVALNPDGVLLVNGAKLFPIGLTLPPPPDGKAPGGRDAYATLHDAGVRLIRTGPTGNQTWNDAAVAAEQAYEDAAARHGLYCVPWLRELSSISLDNAGNTGTAARERRLREVVAKFKGHPGLGVWKGADEPAWGKLPVAPLVRAREVVHEVDPDHPIWIVQAPRGTVETLRPYDPAYDILGRDIYPVSYPPGTHSLEKNKEISMVGDFAAQTREVAGGAGGKPFWMTLQIAWSGVSKPGKTLRMPSFPQERFMAYQAVISGARGLFFFGGHVPLAWTQQDQELGWNWSFWDRVLRPVVEELGPEGPLAAALVAPDSKAAVTAEGLAGVELLVREVGPDLYVLACKREGETAQVHFHGLPAVGDEGEVLFEARRRVKVERVAGGVGFTDWFGPFDVHVYRFERKRE